LTKKELSQLYDLNKEIAMLKRQKKTLEDALENLNSKSYTADTVQGSCLSFPFTKHSIKIDGLRSVNKTTAYKYKSELADVKTLIKLNEEKCVCEYNRLMRYISDIKDSEIRQILTLYFVEGKTWRQVANHFGNEITEDAARVKVDRYLKESEKI